MKPGRDPIDPRSFGIDYATGRIEAVWDGPPEEGKLVSIDFVGLTEKTPLQAITEAVWDDDAWDRMMHRQGNKLPPGFEEWWEAGKD